MTLPEQMRARADREERIYAAPELAKMLRAGADAIEERDRLRELLAALLLVGDFRKGDEDVRDARAAVTPPADEYDFNSRYDARWEPEVTK